MPSGLLNAVWFEEGGGCFRVDGSRASAVQRLGIEGLLP